jgi:plastocyanin
MSLKFLLVAAALVVGVSAAVPTGAGPSSFCQRYALALFNASTSTTQGALIEAVVDRALNGATAGGGVLNTVVGILNQPNQIPFFVNFRTNATFVPLRQHLINFFALAFNCKDISPQPVNTANMKNIHLGMTINMAVWNTFVTELVNTLTSFGVPAANPYPAAAATGTGEIVYAGALLGQFLKGANQICNQADCAEASAMYEFWQGTGATGGNAWLALDSSASITIPVGSTVHWNFGGTHNVIETDSAFAVKAGGFTSGAVGTLARSYTRVFSTAGTFYFICAAHPGTMQGTIVVTAAPSAASGLQASFAVAAAAIAAVFALKH